MDKKKVTEIFDVMAKDLGQNEPPATTLETVGAAVGLLAIALERGAGVDRNATFKMIQRAGHATVKEMELMDKKAKNKVD